MSFPSRNARAIHAVQDNRTFHPFYANALPAISRAAGISVAGVPSAHNMGSQARLTYTELQQQRRQQQHQTQVVRQSQTVPITHVQHAIPIVQQGQPRTWRTLGEYRQRVPNTVWPMSERTLVNITADITPASQQEMVEGAHDSQQVFSMLHREASFAQTPQGRDRIQFAAIMLQELAEAVRQHWPEGLDTKLEVQSFFEDLFVDSFPVPSWERLRNLITSLYIQYNEHPGPLQQTIVWLFSEFRKKDALYTQRFTGINN